MRWEIMVPHTDQERMLLRFAFFPTKVGDYWIWLERYWLFQKSTGNNYFWSADKLPFEACTKDQAKRINATIKWVPK